MHEGVNLLKKVVNESCSATSKTPYRIQSDLSYDLRVERYSNLRGRYMYIATRRTRLEAREAGFLLYNINNRQTNKNTLRFNLRAIFQSPNKIRSAEYLLSCLQKWNLFLICQL